VALVAGDQQGEEGAGAEVDAVPAHAEGLLPFLSVVEDQAAAPADSRVVEEELDAVGLVGLHDRVAKGQDLVLLGDVGQMGGHPHAGRRALFTQRLRPAHRLLGDVAHRHVAALRRQLAGELPSHARATAGDHGDPVVESVHLVLPRSGE